MTDPIQSATLRRTMVRAFRAAAAAHIEAMHRPSALERGVRHAALVSGIARSFETMHHHDLASRSSRRLLRVN